MSSFPITNESRAAALSKALNEMRPTLRFTRGMAEAARRLEREADRRRCPLCGRKDRP